MKQVIIVRSDIGMSGGKAAAQVGHASLGAYKKAKRMFPEKVAKWERAGEKKVVVRGTLEEMLDFKRWADGEGIPSYMVSDAGLTQLEPGTVTALALGPEEDKKLEPTGRLKLL